jgi:DNA polymerase I-like protein with 3'-5' exonuclease and polymerase domains
MIYLVSKDKKLYSPERYREVDFKEAMDILYPLKEVQLDTETKGLDCFTKELLTLQLGCTENQVVFDWRTISPSEKSILKEYLESDRVFLGHNIMFDLTFLYKQNIWPNHVYDTMVVEQLIYLGYPRVLATEIVQTYGIKPSCYEYIAPDEKTKEHWELSYSLRATAKRRLGVDIDKTVRGKIINEGLTEDVVVYAAGDVMWLEPIKEKQLEELSTQDLLKAAEFECEFIKFLAYVKFCGVHLDISKWKEKMKNDQASLREAESQLNKFVIDLDAKEYLYRYAKNKKEKEKLVALGFIRFPEKDDSMECYRYKIKGKFVSINLQLSLFEECNDIGPQCTINWSSSTQVIKLFELLGIQVTTFDKKTKKEKKSINATLISSQVDKFPILAIFLKYQAASKVVSTYGQNWLDAINPVTGRIHVDLHSIGTDTGEKFP